MKVLLLGSNRGSWTANEVPDEFRDSNGIEAYALAFDGRYVGPPYPRELPQDVDIVIANLKQDVLDEATRVRHTLGEHQCWISLVEGCGLDYRHPDSRIVALWDQSDLVININQLTTDWLQPLTKTPVRYLGIPYPTDAYRAWRVPLELRTNEVFVCPKNDREPSLSVAGSTGLTTLAFGPKLSRKIGNIGEYIRLRSAARDAYLKEIEQALPKPARVDFEMELVPFLKRVAQTKLWVNLDPRYTWGRYVLDAAALGVPIISTASTGHGPTLFPETTVENCACVEEAKEIAHRLLNEPEFYKKVIQTASDRIAEYGFGPFRQKFNKCLVELNLL